MMNLEDNPMPPYEISTFMESYSKIAMKKMGKTLDEFLFVMLKDEKFSTNIVKVLDICGEQYDKKGWN